MANIIFTYSQDNQLENDRIRIDVILFTNQNNTEIALGNRVSIEVDDSAVRSVLNNFHPKIPGLQNDALICGDEVSLSEGLNILSNFVFDVIDDSLLHDLVGQDIEFVEDLDLKLYYYCSDELGELTYLATSDDYIAQEGQTLNESSIGSMFDKELDLLLKASDNNEDNLGGNDGLSVRTTPSTYITISDGSAPNQSAKAGEDFSFDFLKDYSVMYIDFVSPSLPLVRNQEDGEISDWFNCRYDSNLHTIVFSGSTPEGSYGLYNFVFTIYSTYLGFQMHSVNFSVIVEQDLVATESANIITANELNEVILPIFDSADFIKGDDRDNVIEFVGDGTWDVGTHVAWNPYTQDSAVINNNVRSFDAFDGGDGYDIIALSEGNDAIFLHDLYSENPSESEARLVNIEQIDGSLGDDVIDLSSSKFTYSDIYLNGNDGDDFLWSNDGNDVIDGGEGHDHIVGGRGNDDLRGGQGNDTIKGFIGDDKINGGLGLDILSGGVGDDYDTFYYSSLEDSSIDQSDVIEDFQQGRDKIDLTGIGADLSFYSFEFVIEDGCTIAIDQKNDFAIKFLGEYNFNESDFDF